MQKIQLARKVRSVSLLRGEFRLRSGIIANQYFDKYRVESNPTLLRAIAERLVPMIPSGTGILGGLELGGVPLATVLSMLTELPMVFVRKRAKHYGAHR